MTMRETMQLERVRGYLRVVKTITERLPDSPERAAILSETHAGIIALDKAISAGSASLAPCALPEVPDYGARLTQFVADLREAAAHAQMGVLS